MNLLEGVITGDLEGIEAIGIIVMIMDEAKRKQAEEAASK